MGAVVFLLPRFVLYSVPGVAAFRVGHAGRTCLNWLERTGLALVAALFLVAEPTELIRNYSVGGVGEPRVMEILVREATMLVAIALGFFLVHLSHSAPFTRSLWSSASSEPFSDP
jgi:hypothetical protein